MRYELHSSSVVLRMCSSCTVSDALLRCLRVHDAAGRSYDIDSLSTIVIMNVYIYNLQGTQEWNPHQTQHHYKLSKAKQSKVQHLRHN